MVELSGALFETLHEAEEVSGGDQEPSALGVQLLKRLRFKGRTSPWFILCGTHLGHAVDGRIERHPAVLPESHVKVAGADEDEVDAVDGGNFVNSIDGSRRLDLDCQKRLAIGPVHVLVDGMGVVVGVKACVVDSTFAERWELRRHHERFCLFRRTHVRNQQAGSAFFQISVQGDLVGRGRADEYVDVEQMRVCEQRLNMRH